MIAGDPDDFMGRIIELAKVYPPSDRRSVRPVAPGHRFVDHHDAKPLSDFFGRKVPARDDGHADGPEIVRSHRHGIDRHRAIRCRVLSRNLDSLHGDLR
jgi:hypothetical protein